MSKFKLNNLLLVLINVVLIFGVSGCNKNPGDPEPVFQMTSSSGQVISLDGFWESDCIGFPDFNLQEDMTFMNDELQIDIYMYEQGQCDELIQSEIISISFSVRGTYEVTLDDRTVVANKIDGFETSNLDGETKAFKQAFYIDDSNGTMTLYHGIFGDDGGVVTSDGYPLTLHNIGIVKQ